MSVRQSVFRRGPGSEHNDAVKAAFDAAHIRDHHHRVHYQNRENNSLFTNTAHLAADINMWAQWHGMAFEDALRFVVYKLRDWREVTR